MSDPIDVLTLRKGKWIILKSGDKLLIQGAYMSSDGVMITAKDNPMGIVARNVPLDQIVSVLDA